MRSQFSDLLNRQPITNVQNMGITLNEYKYTRLVKETKTNYQRLNKLAENSWFNDDFCDFSILYCEKELPIHNIFFRKYIDNNIEKYFDIFYENHLKGIEYFENNFEEKIPSERTIFFLSQKYNDEFKTAFTSFTLEKHFKNNIAGYGFKNGLLEGYILYEKKYKQLFETALQIKDEPYFIKYFRKKENTTNQNIDIDLDLLKYLSENFTSTDKRFNDLTKYNQIYRFLNEGRDYNIEHRAYKNLIKEMFDFDYLNREIKGETQKHQTQLENLSKNYHNSKK